MKGKIIILILCLIALTTIAQNNYVFQYKLRGGTNIQNFKKRHITSDYGPRNAQGTSYWHRGIDLQSSQVVGDIAYSPCPGIIRKISGTGYKYIIIEGTNGHRHFGYGHFFKNQNPEIGKPVILDSFVLILLDEEDGNSIILNLETGTAIGVTSGHVTYNGHEYPVSNTVVAGSPIGPMGFSGLYSNNPPVHLHLYAFRNVTTAITGSFGHNVISNNYDPMAVMNIGPGPRTNFQCRVQNVGINYGANSNSYFKTRVEMPGAGNGNTYTDDMYDVDLVELFLKPSYKETEQVSNWGTANSSYQYYHGAHTKSYINQGGRPQDNPSPIYPISPDNHDIRRFQTGNDQSTGVEPFAYRDYVGKPWDFFWFSDFYPRIRKSHIINTNLELARNNLEARYTDGNYEALLRVYTSVNNIHSSVNSNNPSGDSLTSFQIDNFVPFVQKVEITQDGSDDNYMRQWNATPSGSMVLSPLPNVSFEQQNLQVEITASEAMSEVELNINDYSYTATAASNLEQTIWEFNVPANALQLHAFNELQIGGKDVHGNLMQKDANQIPIRQSAAPSVFSPPLGNGYDENHKVYIGQQDINFTFEPSGSQDLTVQFFPESPLRWSNTTGQYLIQI